MDAAPPPPDADRITLTPVAATNWRAVAGLEVTEPQRAFVTAPVRYLALCAYDGVWQPLAVLLGERVIGFVMWAVDPDDRSCWLGGFLIDRRFQRQGHGRRTLEALTELLFERFGHRSFALAYHPDNPAKALYEALGFRETGEVDDDEVVARWTRPIDDASEGASKAAGRPTTAAEPTTVREGTRDDLPAVVALLADDPLGATRERPRDPYGATREHPSEPRGATREHPGEPVDPVYAAALAAMRAQGGNVLLVAEQGGAVVGCLQLIVLPGLARAGTTRAQLEGVRVARTHRGGGVGEVLVEAAVARAAAAGCGLVQLTTDASRLEAKRFYERLGFEASHHGMKRTLP